MAGGDPKTLIFALLGFIVVLAGSLSFITDFMADKDIEPQSNLTALQDMVGEKSEANQQLDKVGDSANLNTEDEDRNIFSKAIQIIVSQFEDTMLGKAFKTMSLMTDTVKVFSQFVGTLGGILNVPPWLAHSVTIFLILLSTIGVVYFFRGLQG